MICKTPSVYMARKGKWRVILEPSHRYAVNQLHSHFREVENINPSLLPEDNPDNKVTTTPRLGVL